MLHTDYVFLPARTYEADEPGPSVLEFIYEALYIEQECDEPKNSEPQEQQEPTLGDYVHGEEAYKSEPGKDIRVKPRVYSDGVITGDLGKTWHVTDPSPIYDLNGAVSDVRYKSKELFKEGTQVRDVPRYKQPLVDAMREALDTRSHI